MHSNPNSLSINLCVVELPRSKSGGLFHLTIVQYCNSGVNDERFASLTVAELCLKDLAGHLRACVLDCKSSASIDCFPLDETLMLMQTLMLWTAGLFMCQSPPHFPIMQHMQR